MNLYPDPTASIHEVFMLMDFVDETFNGLFFLLCLKNSCMV